MYLNCTRMIANAVHTVYRRQYAHSMQLRTVSYVSTSSLKQYLFKTVRSNEEKNCLHDDSSIQYRMVSNGVCIGRPPISLSYYLQDSMTSVNNGLVSSNSIVADSSIIKKDLSSRSRSGNRNSRNNKSDEPLKNDILIRQLLKRKGQDAESLQVRLLIDKGRGQKSEIEVMSLMEAIGKSTELEVDLVEINLQQEIPVISAVDFQKLLYAKSKSSSGAGASSSSSTKPTKEFKFKVRYRVSFFQ